MCTIMYYYLSVANIYQTPSFFNLFFCISYGHKPSKNCCLQKDFIDRYENFVKNVVKVYPAEPIMSVDDMKKNFAHVPNYSWDAQLDFHKSHFFVREQNAIYSLKKLCKFMYLFVVFVLLFCSSIYWYKTIRPIRHLKLHYYLWSLCLVKLWK